MTVELHKINSRSRTVRYFEDDSGIAPGGPARYYAGKDFEHRAASAWFGRGARMLGLKGPVEVEDFKAVLSGKLDDRGIELGRRILNEATGRTRREHNPGDDLTFRPPKSVSIAALMYGEAEALEAHEEARDRVLRWMEAGKITTRRNQRRETTGRMVAAMFTHDTSRNHDPHLHSHVIVANMTRRDDGKWVSIDRAGYSAELKLISAQYDNELARILLEKGYRLRQTKHGGARSFEIEGYTDWMIQAYSTRQQDILKDLEERGIRYSPRAAKKAALRTRRPKEQIDRAELRRRWKETAERLGFENPCTKLDRWRNRKQARRYVAMGIDDPTGRDRQADLFDAIRLSLDHLGYRTPVVGDIDLKSAIMGWLPGRVTLERIEAALDLMAESGHLIKTRKPGSRTAWVTRETLAAEMGVVRTMAEGQGKARAIRPGFDAAAEIGDRGLTPGQSAAVEAILTGTDRVSGVQGYAGTGKTTMLRTVVEMAGDRKFIGLAPTVGASVLLGAEAGIKSDTLQSFLVRHKDIAKVGEAKLEALRKEYADTVVVVDEASMIGTRQMEQLLGITGRLGVERLVLVGDTKQLKSVQAGQPFKLMQQQGMETAVMEDIVRQKNDGLKVPVEMMLAGHVSRAIERLGDKDNAHGQLVEVDREQLHRSVAQLYLKLGDDQRRGTIVMAQTNHDRQEINEQIREGLVEEGTLGEAEYTGERLVNRHMTPVEKGDALNYEPGDVLVFHSRYRSDNGDDHYAVKEIGGDGRLHIESASGHRRDFDPSKSGMVYRYEVFEAEDIALRTNDLVRLTRNDPDLRERGVINGAEATVEYIGKESVTLRLAGDGDKDDPKGGGAVVELARDHNALRHIDHGYCRTTYSAQGRTAERVIALADSGLDHLADQQNFYVQISRASEEAVVVTDDIEELSENLERHTGERLSAMEAVGMTGPEYDMGMDGDIEMPKRGMDAKDGEIRMPGIVMPNELPQEVSDMLDRLGGEAVHPAVMEQTSETDREEFRDHPQQMAPSTDTPSPTIEVRGIGPEAATAPTDEVPKTDPEMKPEPPRVEDGEVDRIHSPVVGKKPVSLDLDEGRTGREEPAEETAMNAGSMEIEELDPEEEAQRLGEIVADVIEVGESRMDGMVAKAWLNMHEADRETAPGIMAAPDRQENIARIIRDSLERKREIHGPGVEVDRLVQLPLSVEEKRDGGKFEIGDLLVFNRDIPEAGIHANQRVPVVGIKQRGNRLEVSVRGRSEDGKSKNTLLDESMASDCTAYRTMSMELRAGDMIRWKTAHECHGITANEPVEVTRAEGRDIHIRTADSRESVLDKDSPAFRSCDYSFNLSAWDFQNGKVENVLAITNTSGRDLGVVKVVGRELMCRKENVVVFTESIKRLNKYLVEIGHKPVARGGGIKGLAVEQVEMELKKARKRSRGIR